MISWPVFALTFAGFFLTHTVPISPNIKAQLQGLLGARGFSLAYSALSLFMLGAVITAAAHAPYVQLWPQAVWQHYVVGIGMLAVCLLLALTIARPNPFSFGGRKNHTFDPAHAGIIRFTRHPLLVALALWSGLHLLPNGDLAHVIMFGIFLAFALLGCTIIDRRNRRVTGATQWKVLLQDVRAAPFPPKLQNPRGTFIRLGLGLLAYVVLIILHPLILGVAPLPYLF
ncbi:NnrU family protein [uncultured Sulfitobacter sp.]|uniref:NnrU family protein n=1 Tax=uncultured Sulfitobacter sp. TaxID=191468 RepID=UPI0026210C8D|nr:NnrU family protein [uncultured Sulfitobacter sp.]